MAVVWEEPPPRGRQPEWAKELKARPGSWAILPTKVNRHYYKPFGFEFTQRTVHGEVLLYGRYVGE